MDKKPKTDKNSLYFDKIVQNIRILATLCDEFIKDTKKIRETSATWLELREVSEGSKEYYWVNTFNIKEHALNKKVVDLIKDTDYRERDERFEKDVVELRKKYNLSQAYQYPVKDYIIDNWDDAKLGPPAIHDLFPFIIDDPITGEKVTVIKLLDETTITDIQENWSEIMRFKDLINKTEGIKKTKVVIRENLSRDLFIYKLRQSKITAKEIVKRVGEKFPDQPIAYQDVSKIIQRLELKLLEITKGKLG